VPGRIKRADSSGIVLGREKYSKLIASYWKEWEDKKSMIAAHRSVLGGRGKISPNIWESAKSAAAAATPRDV
jgi:hypothetical protein